MDLLGWFYRLTFYVDGFLMDGNDTLYRVRACLTFLTWVHFASSIHFPSSWCWLIFHSINFSRDWIFELLASSFELRAASLWLRASSLKKIEPRELSSEFRVSHRENIDAVLDCGVAPTRQSVQSWKAYFCPQGECPLEPFSQRHVTVQQGKSWRRKRNCLLLFKMPSSRLLNDGRDELSPTHKKNGRLAKMTKSLLSQHD